MRIGPRTTGATLGGALAWAAPETANTLLADAKETASSSRTKLDGSTAVLRSKFLAHRQHIHHFPLNFKLAQTHRQGPSATILRSAPAGGSVDRSWKPPWPWSSCGPGRQPAAPSRS